MIFVTTIISDLRDGSEQDVSTSLCCFNHTGSKPVSLEKLDKEEEVVFTWLNW